MIDKKNCKRLITKISDEGCERSFKELFDIYFSTLFEISLFYLKHPMVAEEVVSDLFLKLWVNRTKLKDINDPSQYLFVATKRQALNHLRSKKGIDSLYIHDLDHKVFVDPITPEDSIFSREELNSINTCIENLPEKCKLVFKLVKEDGMKYKEVATLLDLSEKTVEMHVSNALKKLRSDLIKTKDQPLDFYTSLKTFPIFLSLLFY
ncbi:RNA polymerase sigma-70 factor [Echinicola sediminis]